MDEVCLTIVLAIVAYVFARALKFLGIIREGDGDEEDGPINTSS